MPEGKILDVATEAAVAITVADNSVVWVIAGTPDYVEQRLSRLVPREFVLSAPYPNPFNSVVTIRYALPRQSQIRLEVYNMLGQRVANLVNDLVDAGYHHVSWNARDAAGREVGSGAYLLRMATPGTMHVQCMVLLR